MKRTKHSLSHYRLLTADMGKLYPVCMYEVLPGDVVQQQTSALIRVSPLVAPVMHPVVARLHTWYVPHRHVWADWENFITGGADGLGAGASYPIITAGGGGFTAGELMDYFGVPPGVASLAVSALPVRSYNRVYNEFYRDEDLVTPVTVPTTGGADATSPLTVRSVAWEKDYFSAARPWTQKGPAVSLPLGTVAPVRGNNSTISTYRSGAVDGSTDRNITGAAATTAVQFSAGADATGERRWGTFANRALTGLEADLGAATAATVNDLRRSMALQRYQEARALYGSRYVEYLRYLGIRPSDARLQRPEYLGGGKQTIAFSEVLQVGTNFDANTGVGNLKGHGISAMRTGRFRKFFEEHGIVMTLMSIRPRTMYVNGQHRLWNRRTKEDYWQKELEHIGQQPIARREVFAEAGAGGDTIFGYADRYSEYRHIPSGVAGEFRSTLNFWHLARIFGAAPTLNASFVECDPSKRVHAVQTNNVLWCMVNNHIQARRMVARTSVGRIL